MQASQTLSLFLLSLAVLLAVRVIFFAEEKQRGRDVTGKELTFFSGERLLSTYAEKDGNIWFTLKNLRQEEGHYTFDSSINALGGTIVKVRGYMYPFEQKNELSYFGLSALPTSSCYFCGQGGPESVMVVRATQKINYTQQAIWLEGNLKLNADDSSRLPYQLVDAKLLQAEN